MPICLSPKGLFFTFYCVRATMFHMTFLKCFIFNHILRVSYSKQTISVFRETDSQEIRVRSWMFHQKQCRKRNMVMLISQSLLQQRTPCSRGCPPQGGKILGLQGPHDSSHSMSMLGFDLPVNSTFR